MAQDQKQEFAAYLRSKGLEDSEIWLPKFEVLGIKSEQSLQFLKGDKKVISKLVEEAKHNVEREALKNLFTVKVERDHIKMLKDVGEARRDDQHNKLKEMVSGVENVSPGTWVASDVDFTAEHNNVTDRVHIRDKLGERMLLRRISGGRALRGIYITGRLQDELEEKDLLLDIPEDVVLTGASSSKYVIKNFSSCTKEDQYSKMVDILGYSVALSVNASYGGFAANFGVAVSSSTEKEKTTKVNVQENYLSTIKFATINVAEYSFEMSDLKLCKDAKEELRKISEMLQITPDSCNIQLACEDFFKKFGSHANRGPLSFGGIFKSKCTTRGFSREETETVKNVQKNVVSQEAGFSCFGIGASESVNFEKLSGTYSGSLSKTTKASTIHEILINGGPPEAADLKSWSSGLVANNKTWVLIDRGKKVEPVWDIINTNHRSELGGLVEVLRNTWEKITSLKAKRNLTSILSHEPEDVLKEINLWNEEDELTLHQIEVNLKRLMEVRSDIISKTSNPTVWVKKYLSQPPLQQFLNYIVDKSQFQEISDHIKFLLKQLVIKDELSDLNVRFIPTYDKVTEWLYQTSEKPVQKYNLEKIIKDFKSFQKFLKEIKEDTQLGPQDLTQSRKEDIASTLSQAIVHLRSRYAHKYDDVLITILLRQFQSRNRDNVKPLNREDLKALYTLFSEKRKEFVDIEKKNCPPHLQAYLLKLTVDIIPLNEVRKTIQQVSGMMDDIQPPVQEIISKEIKRVTNCCTSLEEKLKTFKEFLTKIMKSKSGGKRNHPLLEGEKSLINVLRTIPQKRAVKYFNPSSLFQKNEEAHDLLKKIGLDQYYPMQLQQKDALCVRSEPLEFSLNGFELIDPKQLPFLILHKLMSYDDLCRSDLMPKRIKSDDDDDDDEEDGDEDRIHPVDSLLALIICSDNFLHQDLLSRLAKCQFAVPFILPDPFSQQLTIPLWGLRSIVKEWKKAIGKKVEEHSTPVINYRMPIVSFLRFGKHQPRGASKSKVLNGIISESNHNHFFHRDCPGGKSKLILGKGLVDMTWYLPSEKPNNLFPDVVTFLNLHGDARNYPQQARFLSKISSMCFILLTEDNLNFEEPTIEVLKRFSSSLGGVTVLNDTTTPSKTLTKEWPIKTNVINLSNKNAHEITTAIQSRIRSRFQDVNTTNFKTMENWCSGIETTVVAEIHLDEDNDFHREGLSLANRLKDMVEGDASGVKETLLPLQGELWKEWAKKEKEIHRQISRGSHESSQYTADIESQMMKLRTDQLEHIKSLTPFMKSFIESLLKLEGSSNKTTRNYFLQCLKLRLNDHSRESIMEFQQQYQLARRELATLEKKIGGLVTPTQNEIEKIEMYKNQKKKKQQQIVNSSFGLEHLLREMGQMYEAAQALPSSLNTEKLSRLPRAAAELLIDGYPLEIMDGDAGAHVPLIWVTAVLNEVVSILNNPKVYVLSVLGLQSTGKSTMLNTVFGLQFNVSSGRCTRGAFMQLLPVDEKIKMESKFSYILVVDTEGLRAPQLDYQQTQMHDNELATFVIGLASTTLININGEVPGDIDDILQTSVHAFLRMDKVRYRKSCQFIHQNAGSNMSSELGLVNFTEKLDKFTVNAAKEEKCEGEYVTFNDVIQFDDQTDVHYFPGLWKGDPPMAPVNTGYSNKAQNLKYHLIEGIMKMEGIMKNEEGIMKKEEGIMKKEEEKVSLESDKFRLSAFSEKLKKLWDALLKEKFVFSFRNTLEISAYNSLESKYIRWNFDFCKKMREWETKEGNLVYSTPVEKISELVETKISELKDFLAEELEVKQEEMNSFFEKDKQSAILVQWKGKFETKLISLSEDLANRARKHIKRIETGRRNFSKSDIEKMRFIDFMTERVESLIRDEKQKQEELKSNLDKGELEISQLEKIRDLNLFGSQDLERYKNQGDITGSQFDKIKEIVLDHDSNVTPECISAILLGGTLSINQVKKILKQGRLSESNLKKKFTCDWIEMLRRIPSASDESINVKKSVENTLHDFVGGYDSLLIQEISEKGALEKWGKSLHLQIVKGTHYKKVHMWYDNIKKIMYRDKDYLDNINQKTRDIFDQVKHDLHSFRKEKAGFNPTFTQHILSYIDETISLHESEFKDQVNFLPKYRSDIYLTACGYAVKVFEEMAESFRKKNDPLLHLEMEVKEPLFTKYKNQYYQKEEEEAIANDLCALLEGPIKTQIGESLGGKIVEQMSNYEQYFKSKMALKAKILTDLHERNDFNLYMDYITDVKESIEYWLKLYTINYCDKTISGVNTRLQIFAKHEVSRLILVVETLCSTDTESNGDVSMWLKAFCTNIELRKELGVLLDAEKLGTGSTNNKLDLENVKHQIRIGIKELEKKVHASFDSISCEEEMNKWKEQPHEILKILVGCTEQCPFCHEQCDYIVQDHSISHSVLVHRSSGINGYCYPSTSQLSTHYCQFSVASNRRFADAVTDNKFEPYENYQKFYPKWSIPPDVTSKSSIYWKLFMSKFKYELASRYEAEVPDVPKQWDEIKWPEVALNLKTTYKL